jgi:hypothetical protein
MKHWCIALLCIESLWATVLFIPGGSPNFSVVPPSPPIVMSYTQSSTARSAQALRIAAESEETIVELPLPKTPTGNTLLKIWAKTDTETDLQYSLGNDDTLLGFESIGLYMPNGLVNTWQEAKIPLIQTGNMLYLKLIPNPHYKKSVVYLDIIEITKNTTNTSVSQNRIINSKPITIKTISGTRFFYPLYPQITTFNADSYTSISVTFKNTNPITLRAAIVSAEAYRHEQAQIPYSLSWSVYTITEPTDRTISLPITEKALIGVVFECDSENTPNFAVKQISLE